jgi:tRNA pseudouridine38-40 synthase
MAVTVRRQGTLVEVTVRGNAFLRRMVRSLVAVLLAVGRGQMAPADVEVVLEARQRALKGRAAPPRGLTLERVSFQTTGETRRT